MLQHARSCYMSKDRTWRSSQQLKIYVQQI